MDTITLEKLKTKIKKCNETIAAIKTKLHIRNVFNPHLGKPTPDNITQKLHEKALAPATKVNKFIAVSQNPKNIAATVETARNEAIRAVDHFIQTLEWALKKYDFDKHTSLDDLLYEFVAMAIEMTASLNLALNPTPKTDIERRLNRRTSSFNVAVENLNSLLSKTSEQASSATSTLSAFNPLDDKWWVGFTFVAKTSVSSNDHVENDDPDIEDELDSDLEPWNASGSIVIVKSIPSFNDESSISASSSDMESFEDTENQINKTLLADTIKNIQTFINGFNQHTKPTGIKKIEDAIQTSAEQEAEKTIQTIQEIVAARQTGLASVIAFFARDLYTNRFYQELKKIDPTNKISLQNFNKFVEINKRNEKAVSIIPTRLVL